ncbi:hypothetical protein EAG_05470 [Camponotus floridanus]|uniref:Uncharacterized protein n=1 Tax=Camponotus floridanus TaxID=104421 RepID=E2AL82_CAMFO|nr:hypothetical protein EAG_05470 [Camponotus floridanus]
MMGYGCFGNFQWSICKKDNASCDFCGEESDVIHNDVQMLTLATGNVVEGIHDILPVARVSILASLVVHILRSYAVWEPQSPAQNEIRRA